MVVFFIICICVLIVGLSVLIAFFTFRTRHQKQQYDNSQKELKKLQKYSKELYENFTKLNGSYDTLRLAHDKLEFENQGLKDTNEHLKTSYNDLTTEKEKTFENRISGLNQSIEEKQGMLEETKKEIEKSKKELTNYTNKVSNSAIAYYNIYQSYQVLSNEVREQGDVKAHLIKEQVKIQDAMRALKPQFEKLQSELDDLKERHKNALMREKGQDEGLWELSINEKEQELISILNKIKMDYPDLLVDIATIEWKKIWLPKLQDLGNSQGLKKTKGIYRLVLKKDPDVCYVGQAVDIQMRWYEHVKKMIGVLSIGNEKLYKYRPEDFYWSVIETDSKNLNESEHYWIEFYGCKEVGLNRKA